MKTIGALNVGGFRYYSLQSSVDGWTHRARVVNFYTEAIRWLREHEIPTAIAYGVDNNVIATTRPIEGETARLLLQHARARGAQLRLVEETRPEVVESAQAYLAQFRDLETRMRRVIRN